MSSSKSFSIQSADLSIKAEGSWKTAQEMVALYEAYDWKAEFALAEKLDGAGEDTCPPGLILLREIGVYFHLCPQQDGRVTIYCVLPRPKKFLGLFKIVSDTLVTMENVTQTFALRALTKFMADDQHWLQTNIIED